MKVFSIHCEPVFRGPQDRRHFLSRAFSALYMSLPQLQRHYPPSSMGVIFKIHRTSATDGFGLPVPWRYVKQPFCELGKVKNPKNLSSVGRRIRTDLRVKIGGTTVKKASS